jgi:hypothetical protein
MIIIETNPVTRQGCKCILAPALRTARAAAYLLTTPRSEHVDCNTLLRCAYVPRNRTSRKRDVRLCAPTSMVPTIIESETLNSRVACLKSWWLGILAGGCIRGSPA